MKTYKQLTKFGIVVFALASALAGYAVSFREFQDFDWTQPALLLIGLYFLCSGSFSINQAQEWRFDSLMDRTKTRPIPAGRVAPWQAWALGLLFVVFGTGILATVDVFTAYLGFATVIMYNLLYTVFFKRKLAFGAVPGAIPGAMPVVIGYSVNDPNIFSPACLYLFLVMFLWQMPISGPWL
jgi:protoheme IX farnesyltransferase